MAVAAIPRSAPATTPRERIELLCDPGSFAPIRSAAEGPAGRSGDGVVAGLCRIDGRPVVTYAQDPGWLGGSLGVAHANTLVRALELAARAEAPVVGWVASGGARIGEGTAALDGYARVFRATVALTGRVPQIALVCGTSAGGACYGPALGDWVVMTEEARMFLTGPGVVREVLGEDVDPVTLGGPRVQGANGVAHLLADDAPGAAAVARDLLGRLAPDPIPPRAPLLEDPSAAVPADPRRVYDVRDALAGLADRDSLLEWCPRWARSLMCGWIRLEGRSVGVIANQPRYRGGVLDAETAQKGAGFVTRCNAAGVPLLVLVDTPGFMPGPREEAAGVIRLGAGLLRAFAEATVPKVTVVLRKAYGGAFITMNSRGLGADLALAWPSAQIGVMGPKAAVDVIFRRESEEVRAERALEYAAEHLSADAAGRGGWVDEVVEPGETRARLALAFDMLAR